MRYTKRAAIIISIVLMVITRTYAADLTIDVGKVDATGFPTICVTISVKGSDGEPLQKLNSRMISVYEDSIPAGHVSLKTIRERGANVAVLFAVDASLSMKGEPLDSVKVAIKSFAGKLRSGDYVGILAFHDDVEIISDFTEIKDSILARTDRIQAQGSITELHYGIVKGLELLSESDVLPESKILIVLSDGKDEGIAYTVDDCVELGKVKAVPIYSIGYHTLVESKYLRVLERISGLTGGQYNDAPSTAVLSAMYARTFEQIQERATLCFRAQAIKADSLKHSVEIQIKSGQNYGAASISFRSPPGSTITSEVNGPRNWWVILGMLAFIPLGAFVIVFYYASKIKRLMLRLRRKN